MSLHKSLVTKDALRRHRNVLTRAERVKQLVDDEKWEEGRSVFALPKVRLRRVKAGGKTKKAEKPAEVPEAAEATGGTPDETAAKAPASGTEGKKAK